MAPTHALPEVPPPAADARFRLGAMLGRGGSAAVYEAECDDRRLALKVAHRGGGSALARFEREAEALAALGPPVTPALYEHGVCVDGRPFIAMELIEGTSLSAQIAALPGPPDLAWVRHRLLGLLNALERVHEAGFVHRDLKPDNIIFGPDEGDPRLLDFGLVRSACDGTALTATGAVVGTSEYMSPEQLNGDPDLDRRSDLYAVAAIAYEMLALRPPFVGERAVIEHGHVALRPPRLRELVPAPGRIEEVLLQCLAKDPARRPQSVAELRALLAGAWDDDVLPAPPTAVHTGLRTEGRRPLLLLGVDGPIAAARVRSLVREAGGSVLQQRGQRIVCGFSGDDGRDPIDGAMRAGMLLLDAGCTRAVIHVAAVVMRLGRRGVRAFGSAIDQLSWMPEHATGLLLTRSGTALLDGARTRPSEVEDGYFVPVGPIRAVSADSIETPLVGRGAELERLRSSIAEPGPALITMIAREGWGRSRLAREVETLWAGVPSAQIISHCVRKPLASDAEQSLRHLLRAALRLQDAAVPTDPLATLTERIGRPMAEELGAGISVALGWRTVDAVGGRPDALRSAAARGLAEALVAMARSGPVAVILDDAHFADDTTLDALEHATAQGRTAPIWVLVTGTPLLGEVRPTWGDRAARAERLELGALHPADTATLARALLHPVAHVPGEVLDRLIDGTGGSPARLVDLVRHLRRERIVRTMPGTDTWYLAADELDRLPPTVSSQWLASRELDGLPVELADLVRVCAVLGTEVSLDELEAVQVGLETEGVLRSMSEAAAGLSRLCRRGLLVPSGQQCYRFRSAGFQEALYSSVNERLRSHVHEHAFNYWRALPGSAGADRLYRVAHHGAASGHGADAVAAYLALAVAAEKRHASHEAERMCTAALGLIEDDDPALQLRVLRQRGAARSFLTHYEAARNDYHLAGELARRLDDKVAEIELLVAEALICDNTEEYATAAELVETALARRPELLPPETEARLWNRVGVVRSRQKQIEQAVEYLNMAQLLAEATGDHTTRVGSLLLLSRMLPRVGRGEEGARVLEQAIELCERVGDHLHLAAGLLNRHNHYVEVGQIARARADAERGLAIAREMGYSQLEIWLTFSLCLTTWWAGDLDAARDLARRAHELGLRRFRDQPNITGTLQYALILVLFDQVDEARELLHRLHRSKLTDSLYEPTLHLLELALGERDPSCWDSVIEAISDDGSDQEIVEALWVRGRAAVRAGHSGEGRRQLEQARQEAERRNGGVARAIARQLAELGPGPVVARR